MKIPKNISLILSLFLLFSCYEPLGFKQINDYVLKPVYTSALTYFKVVPSQFFDATGTIQSNSLTDSYNFKIFEGDFLKENLVKIDFNLDLKNDFDRDITLTVDFLNSNNSIIYSFSPILIKSKESKLNQLEEIILASNPDFLNVDSVKITIELENKGNQMDVTDPNEFEFKSSVTLYIESSF